MAYLHSTERLSYYLPWNRCSRDQLVILNMPLARLIFLQKTLGTFHRALNQQTNQQRVLSHRMAQQVIQHPLTLFCLMACLAHAQQPRLISENRRRTYIDSRQESGCVCSLTSNSCKYMYICRIWVLKMQNFILLNAY